MNTRDDAIRTIATAITDNAAPGHDAAGGTVLCLTEAVMGVTAGLFAIAGSLEKIAEVIEANDHD